MDRMILNQVFISMTIKPNPFLSQKHASHSCHPHECHPHTVPPPHCLIAARDWRWVRDSLDRTHRPTVLALPPPTLPAAPMSRRCLRGSGPCLKVSALPRCLLAGSRSFSRPGTSLPHYVLNDCILISGFGWVGAGGPFFCLRRLGFHPPPHPWTERAGALSLSTIHLAVSHERPW